MHGECITLLNVAQGVEGGGEEERMGGKRSLWEVIANFSYFGWFSFSNHTQDSVLLLSSNVSQMILHYPTVLSFHYFFLFLSMSAIVKIVVKFFNVKFTLYVIDFYQSNP